MYVCERVCYGCMLVYGLALECVRVFMYCMHACICVWSLALGVLFTIHSHMQTNVFTLTYILTNTYTYKRHTRTSTSEQQQHALAHIRINTRIHIVGVPAAPSADDKQHARACAVTISHIK